MGGSWSDTKVSRGARWPSGRASDYEARGWRFETYLRCVVSLSKTLYSSKVLVIHSKLWLRPDMSEKLLTVILSLHTNKQKQFFRVAFPKHSEERETLSHRRNSFTSNQ